MKRFLFAFLFTIVAAGAAETQKPADARQFPELARFFERLRHGDPTSVVFFGGSITYGAFDVPEVEKNETHSFRALVGAHLRAQSPTATNVKLIDAAIGSNGSELGVFRMGRDVLPHSPDLVLVEFAVNGGGQEAMEGIVRKLKRAKPETAVVIVIVGTGAGDSIRLPDERDAQLQLAKHYGLPCVDVAGATQAMIERRKATLADFFPGADTTHPKEKGHRIYADVIIAELDKAAALAGRAKTYPAPLTKNRFERATMIELSRVADLGDWRAAPPNPRGRWFDQTPARWLDSAIAPTESGAVLSLGELTCSGVGLYFEATQGGGAIDVRVDAKSRLTANCEFGAGDEGRAVVRYAFTFLGASAKHDVRLVAPQTERTAAAYLLVIP